jgi:heme oxygenase
LYVLEGSTLGGQILTRQIHDQLGFTPEYGCQFFSRYGPRVYEMWKTFGQKAEAFCLANENEDWNVLAHRNDQVMFLEFEPRACNAKNRFPVCIPNFAEQSLKSRMQSRFRN